MTDHTRIYLGEHTDSIPEVVQALTEMLHNHDCEVIFTKKDGTERVMPCTLRPDALPVRSADSDNDSSRARAADVLCVWSLDQQSWRSFKVQNVKSIRVLPPPTHSATVVLETDPDSGELVMPIPEHLLQELGWHINDKLTWSDNQDGTFTLTKSMEPNEQTSDQHKS